MNELRRTADDFAAALKSNPAVAAEMVRGWERTNITQFDLAGTVVNASPA
jgi:hypothetical protein